MDPPNAATMSASTTRGRRSFALFTAASVGLALLLVLFAAFSPAEWFPRVPPRHVGVLVRKLGRPLPSGAILAPKTGPGETPYQGVQEDVLLPGWYAGAYDPFTWSWSYFPQTVVPADHVGVLVRLFGEDLPPGRVLADDDPNDPVVRKGVLRKPLEPGLHPVNTWAYEVRIFPVRSIPPGSVGVVAKRHGPLPADRRGFLSAPGERGIQPVALTPGTYPVNPFVDEVRPISRQSMRLDLGAGGRIRFPTSDGFEISIGGTVEWSLRDDAVPLAFAKFGDTSGAEQKLVFPAARAKSQLHGSRNPARDFIAGAGRQTFQDDFERDLRQLCESEGVRVHSVLVSGITPPEEIANPIRDREAAILEREQYRQQIEAERSRIDLVTQIEIGERPKVLAQARSRSVEMETEALRDQQVQTRAAQSQLDSRREERAAVESYATAVVAAGMADVRAYGTRMAADARALARRVEAQGGGAAFARGALLSKIAPGIASILASPDGPFGEPFRGLGSDEGRKPAEDRGEGAGGARREVVR